MAQQSLTERKQVLQPPVVDYRKLRFHNLNSQEYKHLLLLVFWPIFSAVFWFLEKVYPVVEYYPVYCVLDDWIPFNEWFVIPYVFWFAFEGGMLLYTALYDINAFRRMMHFIILTYAVTVFIYFVFPTCQELRPAAFERDNILTRFMAGYYEMDTNTNVCPSIHVIGSLAVMFTSYHCKPIRSIWWKVGFTVVAVLICMSTVFLKQHSIVDVFAAIPLCVLAYWLCFLRRKE